MRRRIATCLALLVCGATQALGYTINIDFAPTIDTTPAVGSNIYTVNYSGTAAAPDLGTVWNSLGAANTGTNGYVFQDPNIGLFDVVNGFASYNDLVDSNGNATAVDISFDASGAFAVSNTAGNLANIATNAQGLMRDYLIAFDNTTRTVNLSGFAPNQSMTLYLYGEGDNTGNDRQTLFTVGSQSAATVGDFNGPLNPITDYVVISNVAADALGQLTITYRQNNVPEGPFNGIQIVTNGVVPEPTSIVLAGAATVGLLVLRRKK